MKWNNEELEKCITLLKEGNSYTKIGLIINRSGKSVKEKLNDCGLKFEDFNSNTSIQKCLHCEVEFTYFKWEKRKFCSQSCSVSFNNKIYIKRPTDKQKYECCLFCKKDKINKISKFCSHSCQHAHEKSVTFSLIEKGDISISARQCKLYLIDKYGNKCMKCGWSEIHPITGNVPIELEHKDGNGHNNHINNLELLCPNCHSLTPTYKALNKGSGRFERRQRYRDGKSS